ncbi:adenosylcobinamide kinase/adenosylcobinamide-phosphate guanylyltransferase [Metabacillus crassostreae]|uniref:bifunctional adenosylcobinamide kinase/adenosylcobinamide-phosphate guanylyltransferase n=1 Tax=Metabacillus crassostreae TaxID=929098 RepID=UPI00195778BA|nr:bifunctional adenosylcobinamide kinase/adenosylcobinamide-phosphate guanylyltransferase [Metabacillus crassostreae]MBM7602987.1 adenosylcobinamide kinase/adenosylcobinamide-phosphate guanylyltransferase [Metabacillus crassostreae]
MITFISGGARSGKSSFAEKLATEAYQQNNENKLGNSKLYYVATAERSDGEMNERINRHINERSGTWYTLEVPINISSQLENLHNHDVLLIDCLTIWLNNMMYKKQADLPQLLEEVTNWIDISIRKQLQLFIVSNDLNEGMLHKDYFTHQYMYALENVHHFLISESDAAYQVVAGIPIQWKGERE